MKTLNVLGMDYGASGGRGMIGRFDGNRLGLEEVHKFPNNPVQVLGGTYWNVLMLFEELKNTLRKAKALHMPVSSVGIDTWASDYGLLDSQGNLLGNPHHYRDIRTDTILEEANRVFTQRDVFYRTGMEPHHRHTLYQLLSMRRDEKDMLEKADTLLFVPNLLAYFLTGNKSCDATQGSAALLYDPVQKAWIREFLDGYGLPDILPGIGEHGAVIGNILDSVCAETGMDPCPVILTPSHDTASAISAVPGKEKTEVIYISSGTWSIIGSTIERPLIHEGVLKYGFNNEIGYKDEIMFVKNVTGLWVLQECLRQWSNEGEETDLAYFDEYARSADYGGFFDIEKETFMEPGDMVNKIRKNCADAGQKAPESKGDIYVSIINSLAKKYGEVIGLAEELTSIKYKRIHIVGGGAKDGALCRRTAKVTGLEVCAGPYEATAIGNIVAQLAALGEIRSADEARMLIETSFPVTTYEP